MPSEVRPVCSCDQGQSFTVEQQQTFDDAQAQRGILEHVSAQGRFARITCFGNKSSHQHSQQPDRNWLHQQHRQGKIRHAGMTSSYCCSSLLLLLLLYVLAVLVVFFCPTNIVRVFRICCLLVHVFLFFNFVKLTEQIREGDACLPPKKVIAGFNKVKLMVVY